MGVHAHIRQQQMDRSRMHPDHIENMRPISF